LFIKKIHDKKELDHIKIFKEKIEKQKNEIHDISDEVLKMTCEIKKKKVDTIQIIKNKESIVIKLEEKELFIKDTIFQYITSVDTITEYITSIDTVYFENVGMPEDGMTSEKKKRNWFKKN